MQYHASRKEIDNAKPKIIFYAICVLYVLSVVCIALETGEFVVASFVSNDAAFFFQRCADQLCAQADSDLSILRLLHVDIAEGVLFGCCDFLAQCILVRTTDNAYRFHLFI
jgi:hypothetical protein